MGNGKFTKTETFLYYKANGKTRVLLTGEVGMLSSVNSGIK